MSWRLARGAQIGGDGLVTFSVWAPRAESLAVRLLAPDGAVRAELSMERDANAVYSVRADAATAPAGGDYVYLLPGVGARPDPVSRRQPFGVHGPSRIVAADGFSWSDGDWRGLPLAELIFYELHVGTFTPEGTFAGVVDKLPYLRDLGVTALELMPVATFPGGRNWGYDGASLFAPHEAYGGPEGLRRLVDACHAHGLALFLDVVYNHLGPEGNYLHDFGPYFTDRYKTPWGAALNFDSADSDEVRRFFVDNALTWLTEYHVDGLRLDAIHGIFDFGARHILSEISEAFHAEAVHLGRRAWLVAESDLNDPRVIRPAAAGGLGLDAQWSDDFHHAQHSLVTGNRRGYFVDFGRAGDLAKAIGSGFVYDGQPSAFRRRRHGAPSTGEPGERFVAFNQNHDQIANACQGRRLGQLVGLERQKVAAMVLFSTPSLPLLFQGEEYGEEAPFDYFTSHGDAALAEAVRQGRHQEYLHLLEDGAEAAVWADPQAEETFERAKLRWGSIGRSPHAELLSFYRALIALRRRLPPLHNGRKDLTRVAADAAGRWLTIARGDPGGAATFTAANFGEQTAQILLPEGGGWKLALATNAAPASDLSVAVSLPENAGLILARAPRVLAP
ncbi:MAG TPA: malto-oligosyltrehalose trehalohydrolase [Polyangia bacterium]|jgi:maltooligosyltrehalose trehalohydrolase|nr:malto-oligosyltrehalose trehalohydrolase [Polyangia bacterium]